MPVIHVRVAAFLFFVATPALAQQPCRSEYDMGLSLAAQGVVRPHEIARNFFNMAVQRGCGLSFLEGQDGAPYTGEQGNPPEARPPVAMPTPAPVAPPPPARNQVYMQMVGTCARHCNAKERGEVIPALAEQCFALWNSYNSMGGNYPDPHTCQLRQPR
jgi:hypothetical protein